MLLKKIKIINKQKIISMTKSKIKKITKSAKKNNQNKYKI